MMSTYKLSFVLGKFKTTQVNNSLRMWSTKTAIDYEENFMRIGQKTWNILEDITGISSNEQFLEKLDFVIIPRSSDLSRYMNGIYPSYNWELCIVNEGDLKEKTYTEALPNLLTYQWFINSIAPDNFHFQSFEHGLSVYIPTFIADKLLSPNLVSEGIPIDKGKKNIGFQFTVQMKIIWTLTILLSLIE
ncbi:hypothetical protein KQX54_006982 [Cotesia glomerata]|uniref:Uncharacterized protein n=1 Tax=Cotesia glomerata TaxID=32391 RepID=A0AAV7J7D2_COTGL|nr:hypothetical protein KQX54_006982 [Cotesia glomerata]